MAVVMQPVPPTSASATTSMPARVRDPFIDSDVMFC
jgi:hypothetical protein